MVCESISSSALNLMVHGNTAVRKSQHSILMVMHRHVSIIEMMMLQLRSNRDADFSSLSSYTDMTSLGTLLVFYHTCTQAYPHLQSK